jgi:hypothetical protein
MHPAAAAGPAPRSPATRATSTPAEPQPATGRPRSRHLRDPGRSALPGPPADDDRCLPEPAKGKFATLMGFAHPRAEPVRHTGSRPKPAPVTRASTPRSAHSARSSGDSAIRPPPCRLADVQPTVGAPAERLRRAGIVSQREDGLADGAQAVLIPHEAAGGRHCRVRPLSSRPAGRNPPLVRGDGRLDSGFHANADVSPPGLIASSQEAWLYPGAQADVIHGAHIIRSRAGLNRGLIGGLKVR